MVHCVTERQARQVREALTARLAELGLELHPGKTKVVYCKDSMRRGEHETVAFTFLGYAFRPRQVMGKNGKIFTSFTPAMSPEALKAKSQVVRGSRSAHAHWRKPGRVRRGNQPDRGGLD